MRHPDFAYRNQEFLDSPEGRPIRILSEYLEPRRRFQEHKIQDTVVFFGSARVLSQENAQDMLDKVRRQQRLPGSADTYDAALRRAQKAAEWSRYYEDARKLANLLTRWTSSLDSPLHRFVVCSGGGPGIMEAANRGAYEAGGKSVGLNINLPFEQGANPFITSGLEFGFHYFFMRKFWFAYLARAIVIFPGGFGTLDEMFELITLSQTHKLERNVEVMLYGSEYWDQVLKFEPLVEWGAISSKDLDLIHRCDDPTQAFEWLKGRLESRHMQAASPQEDEAPGITHTMEALTPILDQERNGDA